MSRRAWKETVIRDRCSGRPLSMAAISIYLILGGSDLRAQEGPAKEAVPAPAPERIEIPSQRPVAASGSEPSAGDAFTARRFNFEQFRSRVEGHWFKRKALLAQNLTDVAQEELKQIEDLCREMGVERISALAAALVHEGGGFLREGNFNKAKASYSSALALYPGLSQAHMGLAMVAWKSGEGIPSALAHWAAASGSSLREGWYGFATLANGLVVALVALAALIVAFSSLLVLRYHRALRHDVEEVLLHRMSPEAARNAGWTVLLFPTLTWILAPWTFAYWLAALFRYANVREKILSLALLGLLAFSGPLCILTLSVCRLAADPTAKVLMETAGHSYQPESILSLEELESSHASDPLYPSLLGILYARGRFLQESLTQYQRAAELAPRDPRPHNNIGNLFFEVGRYAEACQAYRAAIALDRRFLPPYVNLYLAQQKMFDFKHAEEALEQGRGVDAERIAALLDARRSEGKSQEPIESEVETSEIWRRVLARGSWQGSPLGLVGAGMTSASSIAGLGSLALTLLLPALLGGATAALCTRCGRPYCRRCQPASDVPDHCMQCRYLFVKRDGLPAKALREKIDEISRHALRTARVGRVVSLALPGTRWVLAGRTLRGGIVMAAWCALVTGMALHGRLMVPAASSPLGATLLVPATLMAVLTWLAGNLPVRIER